MKFGERIREFLNRIKDFTRSFGADAEIGTIDDSPEGLRDVVLAGVTAGSISKKEAEELYKAYKKGGDSAKKFNSTVEKGVTLLPSEKGEIPVVENIEAPVLEKTESVRPKGGREIDD